MCLGSLRYGRIKVQFHWDRDGKRDENSSCWVRVSSPWAGSGFGGVQIPRVGEEVVVDFVDGQPDRPVVIGRVYNNENMPPVNLPDDATQSGFFTRSKNGDASNANRMMFEDSPGNELLSFVAERDMNTHVKDKQTQTIDGNVTSSISSFRSHTTHSTSDVTLKSGREAKYESDHERLIKTQLTEKIGGNLKEDYLDGVDETIKGTFTSTVSGVATHTMLGYHLNSETSDEEEVTGDVVQSVGVDEIFNINTKSKLNTGSLSWKTPKLGIESKSSSTKIDSASNVDVSAIFGYTMQTEASITNKAPLKFEFELLSSKNKITHVNDVSTSISLTGVKGSVGAQTLGLNVIYLSGVVQNNSKQYFSVGASGISGQLIGKENKDGSLATDLVGLRFNRGLKVWFSGPDSGGGSGKGGSGKGKSDKKEGGGDDKGGKDKNKKSDEPSADCKECKGLSSSKILLAPVVGMAVDGIVDIGMDLASGAVSQATSPHSIDFSLGEERFYHTDFALPGIKKISWTRMYRSNNYAFDQQSVLSPLGPRWMTPYMQFIYLHEETPVFVNFEGRLVRCPQQLPINKEIYDRNEELFWSQVDPDTLQIRYKNDNKLIFKKIGSVFRLHLCTDAQNNILKLDYDDESRLSNLENDLYNLYFRYDDQNRFDEVYYYETDLETGNKVEVVLAKDWDGLTIASEDRIGEQLAVQAQIRKEAGSEKRKLSSEVQYLYEDGEFVPLVQYTNSAAVGLGYGSFGGGSGGAGSLGGGSKGVAPAVYHYVNDQIGTPQILMNADQEVVWEAQSKAWGDTVISAPVSDDGVINNHRFQGQYFDAESELHYNTFRYYDPEIGRFISLDPIGLLGGLNNYQYALDPIFHIDPLGLRSEAGKQARIRALAYDMKQPKSVRGWVLNEIKRQKDFAAMGIKKKLRLPPGMDLAHWRGFESAKGYDYTYTDLNTRSLHKTQHKIDKGGRLQKEGWSGKDMGRTKEEIQQDRLPCDKK
ncbi:Rhs-family protein [Taylorella equigenitalis MCE9]|uniref:Rhs-family protein n=2 Tax=Taylorella equigenitalis TaxID=29575 RepID=A0A654KJD3_TAYEM|nr:Rhs-family protein [Taylorella equigenitalis MCE9]